MSTYVNIYYNKKEKTQRFVLVPGDYCTAKVNDILTSMNIKFTNSKFAGKYEPLTNYMQDTYQYAKKWVWLETIDLTKKGF